MMHGIYTNTAYSLKLLTCQRGDDLSTAFGIATFTQLVHTIGNYLRCYPYLIAVSVAYM
jgi:hypothetical protein